MIPVTQPFMPSKKEYEKLLENLWDTKWLTNNGPYVVELEKELSERLAVHNLTYVTNGTLALQLAIKALDLQGEIITTPFSFIATTTSITWEGCKPVFVDIDPTTLSIDPEKIETVVTTNTVAIIATHVFGIPCDVERIEAIANKYNLKVIYDGAHAFGVTYKGRSIFNYGDISTYSFHATKVFHTVEGGGITCANKNLATKIELLRSYGYVGEDYYLPGINAKATEFHAAMGICNLNYIEHNLEKRKEISEFYNKLLPSDIHVIYITENVEYNYAYYPVLFNSEDTLLKIVSELKSKEIQTRRYFYPSLNKLPYLKDNNDCPVSESISKRILCLPLYANLDKKIVKKISDIINSIIEEES
ncbi:DegT/DnrJ/EryC1/StrS family aminotransferase [Lysinibacillus agricola]|uniref:DegT/DnrJ/EryC1/StrS family aminotransferase n=1 Tax=Lysinibacillus agricola TaxID=2590012 RepID=A0ABX7AU29_9BACI|nr:MULTISPECIES: DegT/DnrJ/EryC1/StrS family aminotransferase [Lysinibacillus]KOS60729.1 aminotransferase DegT [Lysinibacillus sp. FJAT-14222]QQP13255.1 DegT/DnrJ/EryC1/StrS family aminotransferase [Lysinibacillus agricola]